MDFYSTQHILFLIQLLAIYCPGCARLAIPKAAVVLELASDRSFGVRLQDGVEDLDDFSTTEDPRGGGLGSRFQGLDE